MLTKPTEEEWGLTVALFRAARSRRGDTGRDDRKFLEALHYFTVHNIAWRVLPAAFGNWNSVWKRFWRLSRGGVFEAFCQRSRGGFSTKIHRKTDCEGLPLDFHPTGGQASDSRQFETLLDIGPDLKPRAAMADKGYDAKGYAAKADRQAASS